MFSNYFSCCCLKRDHEDPSASHGHKPFTVGSLGVDDGKYDYFFKIMLVGSASAGKTSLLSRYIRGSVPQKPTATLGFEFASRLVALSDGEFAKLQIWDLAGRERLRALMLSHYRCAVGAIIVYSVEDCKTFEDCVKWLETLRKNAEPDCLIMLVGNKADGKLTKREVAESEGVEFARNHNLLFCEASAVTSLNVSFMFETLAHKIHALKAQQPQSISSLQSSAQLEE